MRGNADLSRSPIYCLDMIRVTILVGALAVTACGKASCPPPPVQQALAPVKTDAEKLVEQRREAAAQVEAATRRRGVAWKYELLSTDASALVIRTMYAGVDAINGADMCTVKDFPDIINNGLNTKATDDEKKMWRTALAHFTRVECDTEGRTVRALILEKGQWVLDPAVPDLAADMKKAAMKKANARAHEQIEVEADDPDRFVFPPAKL